MSWSPTPIAPTELSLGSTESPINPPAGAAATLWRAGANPRPLITFRIQEERPRLLVHDARFERVILEIFSRASRQDVTFPNGKSTYNSVGLAHALLRLAPDEREFEAKLSGGSVLSYGKNGATFSVDPTPDRISGGHRLSGYSALYFSLIGVAQPGPREVTTMAMSIAEGVNQIAPGSFQVLRPQEAFGYAHELLLHRRASD